MTIEAKKINRLASWKQFILTEEEQVQNKKLKKSKVFHKKKKVKKGCVNEKP
jgi:hypothetical protein